MTPRRTVCWVSAGAPSAVAAKLTAASVPDVVLAYCETGSEHPDNSRFLDDCSAWIGRPIERLKSDEYEDTWDVWERRKYMAGPAGAPCTGILKIAPRIAWQMPGDIHVFGYAADKRDIERLHGFREHFFELTIKAPLIDRGLTKANCLAIIEQAGIKLPPMYAQGFQCNNCIPCVKATSPDYWSLVRQHYPAEFERAATLSRQLGARLARIADIRVFIDEIPEDHPTTDPIQPACDFMCHIAEQDLQNAVSN
jgi:3'-phosphoadenosine 5'-phosphosulfate sulfotransferase (PAPS reductase)/FAD synthetase